MKWSVCRVFESMAQRIIAPLCMALCYAQTPRAASEGRTRIYVIAAANEMGRKHHRKLRSIVRWGYASTRQHGKIELGLLVGWNGKDPCKEFYLRFETAKRVAFCNAKRINCKSLSGACVCVLSAIATRTLVRSHKHERSWKFVNTQNSIIDVAWATITTEGNQINRTGGTFHFIPFFFLWTWKEDETAKQIEPRNRTLTCSTMLHMNVFCAPSNSTTRHFFLFLL